MSDFLPPVVLPLQAAIGDLIKGLVEADAAIKAWAASIPNATAGIDPALGRVGKNAGASLVTGLVDVTERETHRVARSVENRLRDERGRFVRAGEEAGRGFGLGFLRDIDAKIAPILSRSNRIIGATLGGIGRGVVAGIMPLSIGGLVGGAAPMAATLATATGAIGLLPAAISGAAVGLVTLKMAFHGVGQAIKDAGDPAKFAESLKKLAPAAQETVRAMVALKPALDGVRANVQQQFFAGLGAVVQRLGADYLPTLRGQLGGVAAGFNAVIRDTAGLLHTPGYISSVRESLTNLRVGIVNASGAIPGLISGLNDIVNVGSRFGPVLGTAFRNVGDQFSAFIGNVASSGQLQTWMQNGIDAIKMFVPLLKDLGSIVVSLLHAFSAAGGGAMGMIGQLINRLAMFFRSAAGVKALSDLFKILGQIAGVFGQAIMIVLPVIGQLLPIVSQLLGILGPIAANILTALGPALVSLVGPLGQILTALTPIINHLGGEFVTIIRLLTPALASVARWLGNSSTAIGALASALVVIIGLLRVYALAIDIINIATKAWIAVQTALDVVMDANPVGVVIVAVAALAAAIFYLWNHSKGFRDFFVGAWNHIWSFMKGVGAWFAGPFAGFFVGLWRTIVGVWNSVKAFFTGAWNHIINGFVAGYEWIKAFPGKVRNALVALPGILHDLIVGGIHRAVYLIFFGLGRIVKGFIVLPGLIGHAVSQLWRTVTALTVVGFHAVVNWFSLLPGRIAGFFTDVWHQAERLTIDGLNAIVDWVAKGYLAIVDWVEKLPGRIGAFFANLWVEGKRIFMEGVDAVVDLVSALPGRAWTALQELPTKVWDAVKDAGTWLFQAGKDLIQGLLNGVGEMWDKAVGFLGSLGSDMVKGFKDGLGIKSPSTVFAQNGAMIVAGLVQGIEANSRHAVNAASRMLASVTGASGFGVSFTGGTTGAGTAGFVPIVVNLGGTQMAAVHAQLIPAAQRYKVRAGTTGLT